MLVYESILWEREDQDGVYHRGVGRRSCLHPIWRSARLEWMAGGRCQARRCGEVEGRAQVGEEYWADGRWRFKEDRQHWLAGGRWRRSARSLYIGRCRKMDWPICFQSNVIFIESCSNLVCHACCRAIICLPSFISHRPAICYLYTVLIVHTLHPYSHYCFFMHGYFRLWRSVDECWKEKTEVAPV